VLCRYFDADTVGLDFKGMVEDLTAAPDGSIILLHGEQRANPSAMLLSRIRSIILQLSEGHMRHSSRRIETAFQAPGNCATAIITASTVTCSAVDAVCPSTTH
jgi:hypothetical protein